MHKKTIKKRDLILALQLFLFLIPVGLIQIPIVKIIWYGMLAISMGIYLIKRHLPNKKNKSRTIVPWMFIYLTLQAYSTYINGGNWIYSIFTLIVVCIFTLFIEDSVKVNCERFLNVIDAVLIIEIILEVVAYIFKGHFLQDFACIYIYYSAWGCLHMISLEINHKNDKKIIIVSCLLVGLTIIKPQLNADGTANFEWTFYVMVLLFCLFFIFRQKTYEWNRLFNVKTFYAFTVVFNLLFVVFQNYASIPGIRYILENIMHKDITMTGRTSIWNMALVRIMERPVWGYGTGYTALAKSTDYWTNWLAVHGPHNQFLAIALSGGVITLIAYIILLVMSTVNMNSYRKTHYSVIITVGLIVTFIELSITYRNILNCLPLFAVLCMANMMEVFTRDDKILRSLHR